MTGCFLARTENRETFMLVCIWMFDMDHSVRVDTEGGYKERFEVLER